LESQPRPTGHGVIPIPSWDWGDLPMSDAFAESAERLKQLLARIMKEKDPAKFDELAGEIQRVLDEREALRKGLEIQGGH